MARGGRRARGRAASKAATPPRSHDADQASPIVWNVAGLIGEGIGAGRDYAFDGVRVELGEDLRLASPISGRVHLARTNRGLLVDADVATSLRMDSARRP